MRQFHHQVWRPKMPSLILTPLSFVVALFIVITSAEDGRHFVKSEDLSIQPTLNLEPLKYDIELEIMKGGQLVFGKVYIAVKFKSPKTPIENIFSDVNRSIGGWSFRSDPAPRDRIILHKTRWLEIVPDSIKVEAAKTFEELDIGGGGALVDVPIKRAIKQSKNVVVIELTKNMPLDAYGQISFRYKSTKNPTLYHGTIFDPITNQYNRFIANRLENSSEARHLFPCFSDPQFKTKIRLRLTIPAESGLDVVSNMPVQGTDIFQMGFDIAPIMYHTPVFEITSAAIPLSSLVFVLGHYEQRRYWYKEQLMNYAKVALYEPSGHKGEGVYAYEFAIKAIAWFQEHFELESTGLSLNEIKLVAVPSYKAWKISDGHGVALIDHDLLLIDEKISSPQRKIEAALNVAHAVARQWFSHTVRPQSEEDAWITDGLALHTALRMVDNIEPEFKINQYVLDRHYRRIVFMMVEDEDRELSPRDRVFLEQLTGKSVFDVLQANIVQTDESHFDKIIRKLVVATLKKGISQPKLVDAFGSEGVTKEEINKIIKAKRTFSPLGKRLHVDLTSGEDHQSVTITQPQDETSVVLWPVKMKLRLSSHDGTQTESFNVPLDEFENGRQIIEMKLPEWFRSSEDNWLKVDLGDGQILPYHQLHYSERIIARLGKQIETGNLLTPSERIDILSQQLNTVGVISGVQGHKNVDELIKLIGYYKKEKDPDVLLEVLDAIEWALHWWRDTDSLHSLKIELKEIYKSLNGLKVAGDETISKKRAKSEAALILMLRFFNDETERDAVKAYEQYIYKTPAFLRSAVFQGVHLHGVDNVESRDISQKLAARLDTASLPEERFRIKNVDSSSY